MVRAAAAERTGLQAWAVYVVVAMLVPEKRTAPFRPLVRTGRGYGLALREVSVRVERQEQRLKPPWPARTLAALPVTPRSVHRA